MEKRIPALLAVLSVLGPAAAGGAPELQVEIHTPTTGAVYPGTETEVEVTGGASIYGGVRYLDLFLVLDTSKSLRHTDPKNHRTAGAIGLVRSLPDRGDIRIGVVDFDGNTELLAPLTEDREAVVAALDELDQFGTTDIAEGIGTALGGFQVRARPDATRVILLFTDGKSDEEDAREAMREAARRGVAVHTLMLGGDDDGESILREIANGTGGSFVRVDDPERLPEAFLSLRTTGVESVTLRPGGGAPIPAELVGGSFTALVPVSPGNNRIVATAVSLSGDVREAEVQVMVASGCGELELQAVRDDKPAVSLSDRAVVMVFDASNSMWGRLDGDPKVSVAKEILSDALDWLPADLSLGLRVYGHQTPHARKNCEDSALLVPLGTGSRDKIRHAIGGFRPRGQTPLAYSLRQAEADFGDFRGERAVVLVTDGIESCGGDPVAAAIDLQTKGPNPVHVIGFALDNQSEADKASLRRIAEVSGGKFVTARNAAELREALAVTVGTPFQVRRGDETVARGSFGSNQSVSLPEGAYTVRIESAPPYELPVSLESQKKLELTLRKKGSKLLLARKSEEIAFRACDAPTPEAEPAPAEDPWEEIPAAPAPSDGDAAR